MRFIFSVVVLFALVVPSAALAADGEPGGLFVAAKLGPAVPFSQLGVGVLPRLELGYELPSLDGRLRLYFTTAWTRPNASASYPDDRVAGGSWDYTLRQSYTMLGLGAAFAILDPQSKVVPELAVAPQLHLLTSRVDGNGGSAVIGETVEHYGQAGVRLALGARLALGPGEATFHLDTSITGFDGRVTGQVGAGLLAPSLGYGVVF